MMQFLSNNEYAVITLGVNGHLRGARLKRNKKQLIVTQLAEVASSEKELEVRLKELTQSLDLGATPLLIVSAVPEGSFFFTTRTTEMPTRALADSLIFDAQQQILQLPADFRLQFSTRKTAAPGELEANVMVFPTGALAGFFAALNKNRRRADEFIYPLLALPELPADEKVRLPELGSEFYWQGNSFHPVPAKHQEYNQALIELLKKEISFSEKLIHNAGRHYENFVTLLMLARFAASPDFRHHRGGLAVLPDFMRPRRFRTQLQVAAILLVLLIGMFAFSGFQSFFGKFQELNQLTRQTNAAKNRTKEIQLKLKAKDKEYKEMAKVMDLKRGQHALLENVATISNTLPPQVLVASMRWSETSVDMNLQTALEDPDMAPVVKKLAMYKLSSIQYRETSETVVSISLKLEARNGVLP